MKSLLALLWMIFQVQANSFVVTAYCHCAKCCGEAGAPTASGRMPRAGITVAGPRSLPLGTRVFIEGIGVRTIEDRLAMEYDDRFDVFVNDHQKARLFGRQTLKITILGKLTKDSVNGPAAARTLK